MTDFFATALDAIYDTLGVEASFDGLTETITVIDKSSGADVGQMAPGARVPTLVPALCLRARDVGDVEDLVGMGVSVNGGSWVVLSARPRPTPNGESSGEYYLIIRKAAGT